MTRIELPQGPLNYRVAGPPDADGAPVVFIHPILSDGALWTPVADRLALRGVRSYAPDWPLGSHRLPLNPDADRSPRGVAQMVLDFVAALDLTDVTIVGNDTGGAICQYILAKDPPRIGRAVLANCDAFDQFPPFPFNLLFPLLAGERRARLMANQMKITALRQSWLGFGLLSRNLPPELTRRWIEPVRTDPAIRRDAVALLKAVDPSELVGITESMIHVTKPVTIVWGMADRVFKPALGRRLHTAFADAEFIEAPGARTLLALDAPDLLTDAIVAAAKR
jgi:pimeloyl-ACP methyl ester carboxylesterase